MPGHKHPKLIIDNNDYGVSLKEDKRTRWRCNGYFKTKCKSTLVTSGNSVKIMNEHNHPPRIREKLKDCSIQVVNIIKAKK